VIDLIEVNCASTSPRRKVRCHCFGSPAVAFSASSSSSAIYASSRAIPRISARIGDTYSLRLMVRLKPYSRLCITGPGQGRCAYSRRLRRTHDGQETCRSADRIRPPSLRCLSCRAVNPGIGGQKFLPDMPPQDPDSSPHSRAPRSGALQGFLRAWLADGPPQKGSVRVAVDVDPQSFL
jgi:hypothetical protein